MPKVVLFDNASCAVKNPDWYDSELHPKILDFCKHYGFVLTTTRPRTPRHKGKVERGVGYVKNSAIKGREFDSVAAQNEFLKNWEVTVADTRIHGTTKRHVASTLKRKRSRPSDRYRQNAFPTTKRQTQGISRRAHRSQKGLLLVPPEYLGRQVWVR